MKETYIAHVRESDKAVQTLYDHLRQTAEMAGKFAAQAGLGKLGELAGWLHDDGKATNEFYNYISSAGGILKPQDEGYVDFKKEKGRIDHAAAGAALISGKRQKDDDISKCLYQIAALASISHHTGLIDCLDLDGKNSFFERMNRNNSFKEALGNLDDKTKSTIDKIIFSEELYSQFSQKIDVLKHVEYSKNMSMQMGFITKLILSCLIDADRLDTGIFENPEKKEIRNLDEYIPWCVLSERLERELDGYKIENEVDALRREVSYECLEAAKKPKGLYVLNVPTGGGKTLSSLRFAINHADAQKPKMNRIIYIVPFTTIIDQNAQTTRDILEPENERGRIVLEHHSNLTPEEETERNKLLSENWDAPIVFTTMVQFLDAFFGHGTSSIRRLYRMANAVLIFDEIQALPVKCVHLFNAAVKCLVNTLNSTVVLCTATPLSRADVWLRPPSPLTRGAWIEILRLTKIVESLLCRPPRGGRGLKSHLSPCSPQSSCRPSRGGRGLKSKNGSL
jgi:CRISPR-associated endonuclease/helicase Cas3